MGSHQQCSSTTCNGVDFVRASASPAGWYWNAAWRQVKLCLLSPSSSFPFIPSPIPPSFFFLCLFRCSLSLPPCTPCKECKITFGVFFSTSFSSSSACLSSPSWLSLSLCLYLITLPSCSDLFFLNFELNSHTVLSFKKVMLYRGSPLESHSLSAYAHFNCPILKKKDLHLNPPNSRIPACCVKLNLVFLQRGEHTVCT